MAHDPRNILLQLCTCSPHLFSILFMRQRQTVATDREMTANNDSRNAAMKAMVSPFSTFTQSSVVDCPRSRGSGLESSWVRLQFIGKESDTAGY